MTEITQMQALKWELIASWMVPLLFSLEDAASISDPSDHRTVFHFVSVHFKWALVQRRRQCFWIMFTYGVYLYLWKTLPLWGALFISNHVTHLLLIKPISCHMFLQLFLLVPSTFPAFCCPCPASSHYQAAFSTFRLSFIRILSLCLGILCRSHNMSKS